MRLGEYLVKKGVVTTEEVDIGLREQLVIGGLIGEILIRLGFVRREDVTAALMELNPQALIGSAAAGSVDLPREFLRSTQTVVKGDIGIEICLATGHHDPDHVKQEAERLTGRKVRLIPMPADELLRQVKVQQGEKEGSKGLFEEADVNAVLRTLVNEAMVAGATDIHLEPMEYTYHVRYRVDGIMRTVHILALEQAGRLVSRVKDISGIDVAETRKPQDGSFSREFRGRSIDFRVSTIVTGYGEKVNLRVLDKERIMQPIASLGITRIEDWLLLSQHTTGLILVCGATGSGKTTTLYTTIMHLDRLARSVNTIEDPIEYRLPGITQCQVNKHVNFDFPQFTRAILRNDPDIVVVGEIRDEETANNTVHLVDTGHLVLATMHTTDVQSTVGRMIGLKMSLEQVGPLVKGILVQKLARKRCVACGGKGCAFCFNEGYRGRTLLTDFAVFHKPEDFEALVRRELIYHTFEDDARLKVQQGITDCAEITRVIGTPRRYCEGGECISGGEKCRFGRV